MAEQKQQGQQAEQNAEELSIKQVKQPIKRFINQIPPEILDNQLLNEAIKILPSHYNFEIHKSVWRIIERKEQLGKDNIIVTLQFPEGLMLFACLIADILQNFAKCECIIMGDVTYGACCVDDLGAKDLGSDFLIHYGHSCLVPITDTCTKTLYVFVEIAIDMNHWLETVRLNFPNKSDIINLMGTVQFNTIMFESKKILESEGYNIVMPQEKPRSAGEVLGCTSPKLPVNSSSKNIVLFLCDGRFHMEATMIANPDYQFYQYNPYSKALTIESYDHKMMLDIRYKEVQKSQKINKRVGIVMGTLGRQGSPHILKRIEDLLKEKSVEYFVLLVSELNFQQLELVADEVDFFVQISCPRLSVDWGAAFSKPLLNPYEFFVAMKQIDWKNIYPMDNYSNNGEMWTNYYHKNKGKKCTEECQQGACTCNSKKNKIRIKYE
ncbi:hypothetical protein ABPG74_018229 [Tetrahymena malaccensis]